MLRTTLTFYRWETSRAAACLDNIIPVDFQGKVQCDGYAGYRAFAGRRNGIELAGCWAHVRRKFHEALAQSPKTSGWLLRQIQHLYRIEAGLREHQAGPRLRAAIRAAESDPIVRRLERSILRLKSSGRYLPQSLLGLALDYALGQWSTLTVYLNDGRVEIDNNLVENAIRPTAIGKNYAQLSVMRRCLDVSFIRMRKIKRFINGRAGRTQHNYS